MASISEKRRQREDVPVALYERTEGNTIQLIKHEELAADTGFSAEQIEEIGRYLVDSGDAVRRVMAPVLSITPVGVRRAEDLIEQREQQLAANVGVILTAMEKSQLEATIAPIRAALDEGKIPLEGEDLAEFDADMRTLEDQVRSPRPKREVVRAALRSVLAFCNKPLVSGVLTSAVVTAAADLLSHLH